MYSTNDINPSSSHSLKHDKQAIFFTTVNKSPTGSAANAWRQVLIGALNMNLIKYLMCAHNGKILGKINRKAGQWVQCCPWEVVKISNFQHSRTKRSLPYSELLVLCPEIR